MNLMAALAERRGYLLLSSIVLVLDQASKIAVHALLRAHEPVVVIPGFFNLAYSRNPGGLFGYFGGLGDPWRSLLLTLFPLVAVVLILGYLVRGTGLDRPSLLGLALILGGAVGNLIDRVVRGEVVDFLDVHAGTTRLAGWFVEKFGTSHWPTFNVADSAIVVGAGLLLLSLFRPLPAEVSGGDDAPPAQPG